MIRRMPTHIACIHACAVRHVVPLIVPDKVIEVTQEDREVMTRILRTVGYAKLLLALLDVIVLVSVALLIILARDTFSHYDISINEILLFAASSLAAVPVFREYHLYKHRIFSTGSDQIVSLGKGILWIGILQAVAIFFIKDPNSVAYSRLNILLYIFGGWMALAGMRVGFFRHLYPRISDNRMNRRILAIGAGLVGQNLATRIRQQPELGMTLVAFADDDPQKIGRQLLGKKIFGPLTRIQEIVGRLHVQEIYIAINSIAYDRLLEIVEACRATGLPVTVATNHFRIVHDKIDTSEFQGLDTLTLRPRGMRNTSWLLKRMVDLVVAVMLCLTCLPLFLVIACAIKITSPGPVFYRSNVVGKGGRVFTWYKFRTMVVNRDETVHREHLKKIISENATTEKLKNDPRITSVGRILRKYSLDELPQLFNVIRGEMSLIGPRPCLPYEYEHFDEWHKERFRITPGMTGLWQVFGRNKSDVTFNDSIILDLYYIQNFSLWLDLKIALKTIPVVLFGRGGV